MTAVATWFTVWKADRTIPVRAGISIHTNIDSREKPDPSLRYPKRISYKNDLWWVPPPSLVETIVAQEFPMTYYSNSASVKELRSKVSGATVTKIANDFPPGLIKAGKAQELTGKWS